jgi:hypothetical protein
MSFLPAMSSPPEDEEVLIEIDVSDYKLSLAGFSLGFSWPR